MSKDDQQNAVTPQARHHFTRFDQINQLVGASEAAPELALRKSPQRLIPRGAVVTARCAATSARWRGLKTVSRGCISLRRLV